MTVVGTGFAPNSTNGQVFQCADGFCRQPRIGTFTTDSSGNFTTTVSVATTYVNQVGPTDCRVGACIVYATTSSPFTAGQHHLSFAGGTTTSTPTAVTPTAVTPTTVTPTTATPTTATPTTVTPTTSGPPGTCGGLIPTTVGTSGGDNIFGTPGPDVILGGGGNDVILGLGGDDVICGGDVNDRILGGNGNDRLFGDAGNDTLLGQGGNDTIFGGTGDDRLVGGRDADSLDGGPNFDLCTRDRGVDGTVACERLSVT